MPTALAKKSYSIPSDLFEYLAEVSIREHPLLTELREETAQLPNSGMQISPEQGQLMRLLLQLMNAKRTVEVGVFTGYSCLVTALALPDEGKVLACDVSEEYTAIGKKYFERAGVSAKIDLRIAPALETLAETIKSEESGSFDFAFIDADKANVSNYVDLCAKLVRPGGLIVVDNVLWSGAVYGDATDEDTIALRAFNASIASDPRFESQILPLSDGLALLYVR